MEETAAGDEKIVRITTVTTANEDFPWPVGNNAARNDTYIYVLEYKADGTIKANSSNQNWESTSGYPPGALYRVTNTIGWHDKHCQGELEKDKVDALYAE